MRYRDPIYDRLCLEFFLPRVTGAASGEPF